MSTGEQPSPPRKHLVKDLHRVLERGPATWTRIDRDYETLRINMHTLFHHLGITTRAAVA